MERKSRFYLERSLREFIRFGVNLYLDGEVLVEGRCIMSKDNTSSPDDLFATLTYVGESRSTPHHSWDGSKALIQQAVHTRYMVEFFRHIDIDNKRHTSHDAAQGLVDFVDSHLGIAYASNMITDGRLTNVYVYQTNGENKADAIFDPETFNANDANIIVIPNPEPEFAGNPEYSAKIKMHVSSNGKIESGYVVKTGQGFASLDKISYPTGSVLRLEDHIARYKISGEVYPTVVPAGKGFVVDRPLFVEEVDYRRDDQEFEPRSVVDMDISFIEEREDPYSHRVEPYEMAST